MASLNIDEVSFPFTLVVVFFFFPFFILPFIFGVDFYSLDSACLSTQTRSLCPRVYLNMIFIYIESVPINIRRLNWKRFQRAAHSFNGSFVN